MTKLDELILFNYKTTETKHTKYREVQILKLQNKQLYYTPQYVFYKNPKLKELTLLMLLLMGLTQSMSMQISN